jgi:hypothetical protein
VSARTPTSPPVTEIPEVEQKVLEDVRARCVSLNVVAAKKPGLWIVRAVSPFTGTFVLRRCVEQYVGTLDAEIEWTTHEYDGWPGYIVYGEGDLPRIDWPSGVYKFEYSGGDVYRKSVVRLGSVR